MKNYWKLFQKKYKERLWVKILVWGGIISLIVSVMVGFIFLLVPDSKCSDTYDLCKLALESSAEIKMSNPILSDEEINSYIKFKTGFDVEEIEQMAKAFKKIARNKKDLLFAYINLKKYKQALELCQDLVSLESNNSRIFGICGYCYGMFGQQDKEIEMYDIALEIDPIYFEALDRKAVAYMELKNYPEAISIANNALTIKPDSINPIAVKADAFYQLEEYNKSINEYKKLIIRIPDNPRLLVAFGNVLYKSGNKTGAIQAYDKALSLDPNFSSALKNKLIVLNS